MKLLPALTMALALTFGLNACGDDGGGDGDGGGGSKNTDSGNAEVQAYCDAVNDYVEKVTAASSAKDAAALGGLQAEAAKLAEASNDLLTADLDSGDADAIAKCGKKAGDAAQKLADLAAP